MTDAPMTDAELAELGRLHAAATPGEWLAYDGTPCIGAADGGVAHCGMVIRPPDAQVKNQACIVAARNALPRLLAEVRRLRAVVARLPETADGVHVVPAEDSVWHPVIRECIVICNKEARPLDGINYRSPVKVCACYSTEAAAEAARVGKENKP